MKANPNGVGISLFCLKQSQQLIKLWLRQGDSSTILEKHKW